MKKILLLAPIIIFNGCSLLTVKQPIKVEEKKLSCEEEAEPKSLQFLEQQYRCTSN